MSKPSLETLLVPDEDARKKQAADPNVDVQRLFSDQGKRAVRDWFGANYEADPSLFVDYWEIYSGFRSAFAADGTDAHDAFLAMLEGHVFEAGDSARPWTAKSLDDATDDPSVRVRRKSALVVEHGRAHADPTSWILDGVIAHDSVGAETGAPGDGKSWVALSQAKSIAYREPWMGRAFDPDGRWGDRIPRVVYISFEGPKNETQRRLALLGDSEGRVMRIVHPPFGLIDDAFWNALETLKPDVVFLDTLSSGSPGVDEKDARAAAPLIRAGAFAHRHGTAFVVVHHSPKLTGTESLLETIRGSSAIAAALDTVFFVKAVRKFASKDPKEHRAVVVHKKMRVGGDLLEPFTVKLTDARGLELYEERRGKALSKSPQTDEDVVYGAIEANPGIAGVRTISTVTGLSAERVTIAKARLVNAERIENRGTVKCPEHHVKVLETALAPSTSEHVDPSTSI